MLIAIDHGNKQMKTAHHTFTTALHESETRPALGDGILKFNEKYYIHSEQRLAYQRDKTQGETFFILTLFAVAQEIKDAGCYTSKEIIDVQLAVGLPPAHYGQLSKKFADYFSNRGLVSFEFQDEPYFINIDEVRVYPQAYAAATTVITQIANVPKAVVIDIGGYTADYLVMLHGRPDLSLCDSLEAGVIRLYNSIRSKVNAEQDMLLDEWQIDAILNQEPHTFGPEVVQLVEAQATAFITDLLAQLRERQLDLKTAEAIFVGGGAILLRRFIDGSGRVAHSIFVNDIRANVRGYDILYRIDKQVR